MKGSNEEESCPPRNRNKEGGNPFANFDFGLGDGNGAVPKRSRN
jgi:hypothetical protein